MSWLLDTDVICRPAMRHGDGQVIAWLEEEQDRCYKMVNLQYEVPRPD